MSSTDRLKEGLPTIRIPIEGINEEDIRKELEQVRLYETLLLSSIFEVITSYLVGISKLIQNHNEGTPITKTVNMESLRIGLYSLYEEIRSGLHDLRSDLECDLERAIEDEEDYDK